MQAGYKGLYDIFSPKTLKLFYIDFGKNRNRYLILLMYETPTCLKPGGGKQVGRADRIKIYILYRRYRIKNIFTGVIEHKQN